MRAENGHTGWWNNSSRTHTHTYLYIYLYIYIYIYIYICQYDFIAALHNSTTSALRSERKSSELFLKHLGIPHRVDVYITTGHSISASGPKWNITRAAGQTDTRESNRVLTGGGRFRKNGFCLLHPVCQAGVQHSPVIFTVGTTG